MTTCTACSCPIPDPAERWPDGSPGPGVLCQECWEAQSDAMWWATMQALDWADALGASATLTWEVEA
jgi:hypothetical protein